MKLVTLVFLLLSFQSYSNTTLELPTSETKTELYPGKGEKKNKKHKRANRRRNKMCKKMHRNIG